MDTFMDKLAQKLTAQEMIKANTAADAEEMKKLKTQVKEYRDILEQLQKLIEDGNTKLENAKVDGDEINRLVEESIAKINRIQLETQDNGKLQDELKQLDQSLCVKLDDVSENFKHLEQLIGAGFAAADENVHKECVKVYRNVQAVVVEENAKQTETVVAAVNALKGKLGAILTISIISLIVALGSVAFQVLTYLQII